MPIRILVNGAFGRMGQLVVKTISEYENFELVGQTGREYDLKKSIQDSQAQVVIDFTRPDSVFGNTMTIIQTGARPVIGTSGLKEDEVKTLQAECAKLKRGGIIAPNFSMGAVLMLRLAKEAAKHMCGIEIIERHHETKADSPSGTALRTAQFLAESMSVKNQPKRDIHETIPGSRGANHRSIPIHSIRLAGILANQEIIFGNPGETLSLIHNSVDRSCYMKGVVLACQKVIGLDSMVYGLEEIL